MTTPRRSRQARRLSTLLTADANVWVVVKYVLFDQRWAVQWIGGPSPQEMYDLAASHLAYWVGLQASVVISMDENCQVETLFVRRGWVEIGLSGEAGDARLAFTFAGLERMRGIVNAAWDQVQAREAEGIE